MSVLKGREASIKVGTTAVLECQNWTLDIGTETVDTTSFGDQFREFTATFATWSGTAKGNYALAGSQASLQTAVLGGSTVDVRFYVDSTYYYHGDAYVSAAISAAVDGIVEVNWSFSAASALTYH